MNGILDNTIKYRFKSWALKHKPPAGSREKLIQSANLFSLLNNLNSASSAKSPDKKYKLSPHEWFKMWGALSPIHFYTVRIGSSLHLFN